MDDGWLTMDAPPCHERATGDVAEDRRIHRGPGREPVARQVVTRRLTSSRQPRSVVKY